jgi:Bifunctional DNA primase/polymerase, N-terminal
MINPLLDTARHLVSARVSPIPIKADGSKAPASTLLPIDEDTLKPSWTPYQTRIATEEELGHWFSKPNVGIAVVAGEVSGNLEILDIDEPALVRPWYELVEREAPGLVSRLVVVKTPRAGHGRHCYYRCAVIAGNTKLAQGLRPDGQGRIKVATLIETRGEGGYCLVPPSPATCHTLNRPYVLAQGDFAHIPTITEDERGLLLACARALNEYVEPERLWTPRQPTATDGTKPGDIFAAKVSWDDILLPHGWTVAYRKGETTFWKRPGKKGRGISATAGHCGDHLYVFSSNAHPLEPERAYSKFSAFARLNYGGDFRKAATALAALGYVVEHANQRPASGQGYKGYRAMGGYRGLKGLVTHG